MSDIRKDPHECDNCKHMEIDKQSIDAYHHYCWKKKAWLSGTELDDIDSNGCSSGMIKLTDLHPCRCDTCYHSSFIHFNDPFPCRMYACKKKDGDKKAMLTTDFEKYEKIGCPEWRRKDE